MLRRAAFCSAALHRLREEKANAEARRSVETAAKKIFDFAFSAFSSALSATPRLL
jgi:hypothetical protein